MCSEFVARRGQNVVKRGGHSDINTNTVTLESKQDNYCQYTGTVAAKLEIHVHNLNGRRLCLAQTTRSKQAATSNSLAASLL